MLKLFITGIVLGILAAAGALYAYPAVDQHREASLVKVAPNGGVMESFHINVPDDRIMSRSPGRQPSIPENLAWPTGERFDSAHADEQSGALVEWVLHLPARGSQFISMQQQKSADGLRRGVLQAGSREFDEREGSITVRWVADTSGREDAPDGRIELETSYVGKGSSAE
jgi:hypothetical protein